MRNHRRFWTLTYEDVHGMLHFPTVRDMMRQDLSQGRATLMSLDDVFAIAQAELGFSRSQCLFPEGEVSKPMVILAAVWAWRQFPGKATNAKCRSFGQFIGEATGECFFGTHGWLHRQAWDTLEDWQAPPFTPAETRKVLGAVLRLYGFMPAE